MKRLLIILSLLPTLSFGQPNIASFQPRFVTSKKSPIKVDKSQPHTFGYLEVPENRSNPNSQVLRLPVYIFKSRAEVPEKDPIIWVVGGPGSSIMRSAAYTEYYSYLEQRDLILVEQRGTAYAQPSLDCPEWAKAVFQVQQLRYRTQDPATVSHIVDSLYHSAASVCKKRLENQGIDLNGYNTREIAADIEALRKTLGIEQYNLLSLSYGTKIAQTLMRDYPKGIRSVVMDSPLPLEVSYDEQSVQNLLETYDYIFEECEQDPDCNQAFPELKSRFYQFLTQITETPLALQIQHSKLGREVTCFIRGKDIAFLLGTLNTPDMPRIPLMISHLLAGDYSAIKQWLSNLSQGSGTGMGMRLSVWCAEETPFASREVIQNESQRYPAIRGASPAVFSPEICDIWGVKPLPITENQPVKSDIPTLLISGEYDDGTPVKWAKQLLKKSFQQPFVGLSQILSWSYYVLG